MQTRKSGNALRAGDNLDRPSIRRRVRGHKSVGISKLMDVIRATTCETPNQSMFVATVSI